MPFSSEFLPFVSGVFCFWLSCYALLCSCEILRAKEAQRSAEITAQMVDNRRMDYHRLSEEYEAAEIDLNEGAGLYT